MALHYFTEGVKFKLDHPRKTATWIKDSIQREKRVTGEINYIFCTDLILQSINQTYLNHDDFTDIITFDYSEKNSQVISGDVYISIDRVKENSSKFNKSFDEELHRVMIHGILHLLGYMDKKTADKAQMRKKEEAYLSLRIK